MSSGHASHKGTSAKPNVNADDKYGEAADPVLDPQDKLSEDNAYPFDPEAPEDAAATERPES